MTVDTGLSARRYTTITLPVYRFVPGRFPHPTAHPDGHSYEPPGHSPPRVRYVSHENWRESEDYLYGCDLYNHGYWWEAHEAWEGLWQLTDKSSPQGWFLQGLIQTGACHLKQHLRHQRGVDRLLRTSQEYLQKVLAETKSEVYMGLNVKEFSRDVQVYYEDLSVRKETPHDFDNYPFVILPMPQE
jgi:predicted metal-dependent hydrolase